MGKKRRIAAFAIAAFLSAFLSASPVFAEDTLSPQGSPWRKLQRGGANTLTGGFEFFYHLRQRDRGSYVPPWVVGLGKSFYYTVRRTGTGLYEILTFPIPYPDDYLPVIEPEFVWDYPAKKN
jgi:putative exosortase-associated protein (TIGR04073 family)